MKWIKSKKKRNLKKEDQSLVGNNKKETKEIFRDKKRYLIYFTNILHRMLLLIQA